MAPVTTVRKHGRFDIKVVDVPVSKLGPTFEQLRKRVLGVDDASWVGCTPAKLQEMLNRGALDQIEKAKAFADKVDRKVQIETTRIEMQTVPSGGAVLVAPFLSGNPMCFRRAVVEETQMAPIRVFVDVGCSGGFSKDTLEKRGLAMLAFTQCLAKRRPVELVAFTYLGIPSRGRRGNQDVLVQVRLGLRPVNWAMAGAVVGHSGFLRDYAFRAAYDACDRTDRVGMVSWGRKYGGDQLVDREVLNAKPEDVVLGGGYLTNKTLLRDPVQWVVNELDRVVKMEKR